MTLSPDSVLWSALAVTMAYTVFGLTGFGASIAAMPLLAHFFPLRFAVPMMLVFDLCAGFLIGWRNHAVIDKSEVKRLVPFMLLGIALGATLLVKAPEGALLLSLGCFVLAYAAYNFLFRPGGAPIVPVTLPKRPVTMRRNTQQSRRRTFRFSAANRMLQITVTPLREPDSKNRGGNLRA